MINVYTFLALFFSFGCAFCQTNDVLEQNKKNTHLVLLQPDASMLNQDVNNKDVYALVSKKSLVLSEAVPNKSEAINEEATKKNMVLVIKH